MFEFISIKQPKLRDHISFVSNAILLVLQQLSLTNFQTSRNTLLLSVASTVWLNVLLTNSIAQGLNLTVNVMYKDLNHPTWFDL